MKYLLTMAFVVLGINAMAADGSSGCGPGWYLLKDNSLVSSSLRATTNGILFPVYTIGMTVGTSNCTKHSIVQTEKASLEYVTQNMYELEVNTVKASGEHLNALASTIGCSADAQSRFNSQLQAQYSAVFSQRNPEAILGRVYNVILTDSELTNKCSLHNKG